MRSNSSSFACLSQCAIKMKGRQPPRSKYFRDCVQLSCLAAGKFPWFTPDYRMEFPIQLKKSWDIGTFIGQVFPGLGTQSEGSEGSEEHETYADGS